MGAGVPALLIALMGVYYQTRASARSGEYNWSISGQPSFHSPVELVHMHQAEDRAVVPEANKRLYLIG